MVVENTTQKIKPELFNLIKQGIIEGSIEGTQMFHILSMMENIVNKLEVQKVSMEKDDRYWNNRFNRKIGKNKYDFSVQALKQEKYTAKNIILLNSLQGLVDSLGAVLTHRPLTQLSAAYSTTSGKVMTEELNPIEFYKAQNLASAPLTVSISNMRKVLKDANRNFKENRVLTKLIASLPDDLNRGHVFERLGRYKKDPVQRISQKLLTTISEGKGDNIPWIQGGDDREKQKKFLGTNSSGSLTTASLLSIEEITSYFMQLKSDILKIIQDENLLNNQVEAIYKAFVDTERKNFYNGSFEEAVINEFLTEIENTINKVI